jgi:hypothetical protein
MPAPHAFYSKMLAERTASRNVFVLFYFILFYLFYFILFYFILLSDYLTVQVRVPVSAVSIRCGPRMWATDVGAHEVRQDP